MALNTAPVHVIPYLSNDATASKLVSKPQRRRRQRSHCKSGMHSSKSSARVSIRAGAHLDGPSETQEAQLRSDATWLPKGLQAFFQRIDSFLEQNAFLDDESSNPTNAEAFRPNPNSAASLPNPNSIASLPNPVSRPWRSSEWSPRRRVALFGIGSLAFLPLPSASASAELAEPQELQDSAAMAGTMTDAETKTPTELPPPGPRMRISPDTTVTQRVYLDLSLCPTAVRLDRTLGDRSLICRDGEPMGRVVLGLYGNQVPVTVQHFVSMVTGKAGSTYKGSIIHRYLPGQYIMAGHQGSVDKGEVAAPKELERNPEPIDSKAFLLGHQRPGTVSLALAENDDDDDTKLNSDYRNVEFLITTGPGPATQLDSRNVVFGTVLEGMDVIRAISEVPTFVPSEQIQQFNDLAVLLGDDRAAKGRSRWNKPLKAIVISDCGLVEVTPPLLPPSLP